MGTTTVIHVLQ